MNTLVKVTVVIALYNKAPYIKKCIESVLNQSMASFELIVVDDGSTDASRSIVEQIKDPRLKLISIANAGPGVARNTGLNKANTEFVSFLDADDYWHQDFLKTALDALVQHQECDLWLCGASWEPMGDKREPCLERENGHYESGPWKTEITYSALETYELVNLFATGAVVAKTKVIKKYKGYFDRIRCTSGEDGYLWLQAMHNHWIYRERALLLTINAEASALGIGRRSLKPTPPWLLYPDPIVLNCPSDYKPSLLSFLDLTAFRAFRRAVFQGKFKEGLTLWWHYPYLSRYRDNEYPFIGFALFWYPFKHYVNLFLNRKKDEN